MKKLNKIIHVVPSYKPAYIYGGPIKSIAQLCEALCLNDINISVITTNANGPSNLNIVTNSPLLIDNVTVTYFKRITGDHTHLSLGLWSYLFKNTHTGTIIHIHSWWNPLVLIAARIALFKKAEIVISPRGMLSEYSQQKNKWYKKSIHFLFGKSVFKKAYLHATSNLEVMDCIKWVNKDKIFNIYNLINLPLSLYRIKHTKSPIFSIVFLSRIESKKGLEVLFGVLSKVKFPFVLNIAGDGEKEYIAELNLLSISLGIEKNIYWHGWIDGDSKFDFLAKQDLFVLPSYNENFANVVVEALAIGTPVLVSDQVGLFDLVRNYELGWVCEANEASLLESLNKAFTDQEKRNRIRDTAPQLIKELFNEDSLIKKYIEMYNKIANA